MFFALVAMVMMTMSAHAQSNGNYGKLSFDRLSNYLELSVSQVEPVKTAMAQFKSSMEVYYQQPDSKKALAWEKIQDRHKKTMKSILTQKQYDKYVATFELTVRNTAERIIDGMVAAK